MPRELYLVSSGPLTFEALVRAGADVDAGLALRTLYGGATWQLVDEADVAVITVDASRRLDIGTDVRRISPSLGSAVGSGNVWWTEATAPWGGAGAAGVRVWAGLAQLLHGQARVEDGR